MGVLNLNQLIANNTQGRKEEASPNIFLGSFLLGEVGMIFVEASKPCSLARFYRTYPSARTEFN